MTRLMDGMILYHASYVDIPSIQLEKTKKINDFGKGFYVTSSHDQAKRYVPRTIQKAKDFGIIPKSFPASDGVINSYRLHLDESLLVHTFAEADISWLRFVAANRDSSLFQDLLEKYMAYDVICGKIANDRTAVTLSGYISSLKNNTLTNISEQLFIALLLPNRLHDQLCFKTQKAICALEFINGEKYGK